MKKQRVTLYIDAETWRMFRQVCLMDGTSASAKVEQFMVSEVYDTNLPEIARFGKDEQRPAAREDER